MKILFIQPQGTGLPPLGLMYVGASLKQNGYNDISLVDLKEDSDSPMRKREYLEKMLDKKPDVIGISATTPSFKEAIQIARIAREHTPMLIIGGPHATIFQEQLLQKYPFIDAVVYGEGEITAVEFMNNIENLKGVKGVIYRENGKIIKNEPRPRIENLDSLPFPDRTLIDMNAYHGAFSIMTSRGCPHQCTFCCSPVTGKIFRYRNPKNVVDEIEFLVNSYPKLVERGLQIAVSDECFNTNIQRAKDICDEIVRRNLKVALSFQNGLHVRTVDLELFQKMKTAGCNNIWFGIESGNEKVLKDLKKGITKGMVRNAVKLAREAGIERIAGHFMLGLPGDTKETAMDTINFMKELRLNYAGFNQTAPLPNTELWEYVKKNGHFLFKYEDIEDYEKFRMSNTEPQFETPEFTAKERVEIYDIAIHELDSVIRSQYLNMKSVKKIFKRVRTFDDMKWLVKYVYVLFFGKDIRRLLPQRTIKKNE